MTMVMVMMVKTPLVIVNTNLAQQQLNDLTNACDHQDIGYIYWG